MKKSQFLLIMAALSAVLFLSVFAAICYGTVSLPYSIVWQTFINEFSTDKQFIYGTITPIHDIIWLLRIPRVLLAICVGAGLSICGVVMQAIVKNPLADPYILGVSAGASLGATVAILLGTGLLLGENFVGIAAFLGAFLVSLSVVSISNVKGKSNSIKLLLAGMALNAVCSAFSSFIIYFANNMEGMQTIVYWLMGSLSGAKWETLVFMYPVIFFATIFFCSQSRILNLMLMGDETSLTLGYRLHIYRQVYLLLSSLMVGLIVSASGIIGFVGLLIPHVVRLFVGTDHKRLLPAAALVGAIFLIWADILCRIVIPKTELPIGILVAMVGAPCFVYLLVKKGYNFGGSN